MTLLSIRHEGKPRVMTVTTATDKAGRLLVSFASPPGERDRGQGGKDLSALVMRGVTGVALLMWRLAGLRPCEGGEGDGAMIFAIEVWTVATSCEEEICGTKTEEIQEFADIEDAKAWAWERMEEGYFVRLFRR